jgi:hypothetical protein
MKIISRLTIICFILLSIPSICYSQFGFNIEFNSGLSIASDVEPVSYNFDWGLSFDFIMDVFRDEKKSKYSYKGLNINIISPSDKLYPTIYSLGIVSINRYKNNLTYRIRVGMGTEYNEEYQGLSGICIVHNFSLGYFFTDRLNGGLSLWFMPSFPHYRTGMYLIFSLYLTITLT